MSKNRDEKTVVDWSKIPTLSEVELFMGYFLGHYPEEEIPTMRLKKKPVLKLSETEYTIHHETEVKDVINLYEQNGFEAPTLLQDPIGHPWPTVACPIGFPFNLPFACRDLRRFNRWICRVHVEIARLDNGAIVSVPHLEPDPKFHPFDHIWDTYIKKRVVRGKEAVAALNFLGIK